MSSTYELSGVPLIAVRLGSALQGWGTRAAQPMSDDDLRQRQAELREAAIAREARECGLHGMYRLL